MKLWKISRNDRIRYDEYDSAVVVAKTEEDARLIHPNEMAEWSGRNWTRLSVGEQVWTCEDWAPPHTLSVEYLGTTDRAISGVILASFNAG